MGTQSTWGDVSHTPFKKLVSHFDFNQKNINQDV